MPCSFVACCIVERFGSNEVVHVQVAVVAVFCHLLAVNGIAVLRVYLLGGDLLKTVEVAFAAVTVAASYSNSLRILVAPFSA